MSTSLRLTLACALVALGSSTASAWSVGSQLDEKGCHETITAQALRDARTRVPTAPVVLPDRDEAAMIADVQFQPPSDFVGDLAGMSLLLGVRDNDLKGQNPLSTLDLIQVHGNPTTQMEHCIRAQDDDDPTGNQAGLATCVAFIRERATEALDGLDANGMVDPSIRMPLKIYVSVAGEITPELPLFYVRMGQAVHALEDSFTHTYRSADGMQVTVMLNWIDFVANGYDEARDGPPHRMELDQCQNHDPIVDRNFELATQAATELLSVALDPARTREQKIAAFDVVTTKYLSYQAGCSADNSWCDAPEATAGFTSTLGCNAAGDVPWVAILLVGSALLLAGYLRRRPSNTTIGLGLLMLLAMVATQARADNPPPAPAPAPAPPTAPDAPAVAPPPAATATPSDATDAAQGKEPGRDVKTPTVEQVDAVRQDKRLGNAFGFAASLGGSVDRGAGVGRIGGRYRITERWLVGMDAEWNPWFTTAPLKMRTGVANVYATLVRRFPMKYDRVNLRSSLHLGASMLLFDVYGAPKYSVGPVGSLSLLGLDYDLGNSVRLVVDPAEITVAVPMMGGIPLVYEQFRFMIGLQIGA